MAIVVATAIEEMDRGYTDNNQQWFVAALPDASAADSITFQLPGVWAQEAGQVSRSVSVLAARAEQWTTAAIGARTKTNVPITITNIVESTGLITILVGSTAIVGNASTPLGGAQLFIQVALATR